MSDLVRTTPAQLVRAPSGNALHYLISVANVAATLSSLIPVTGLLPEIPVPNISGPAGSVYKFTFIDLWSEEDPLVAEVRATVDGQSVPVVTGAPGGPLGYQLPQVPSFLRIPCDPADVQLVCSGAGPVLVNLYLGIGANV